MRVLLALVSPPTTWMAGGCMDYECPTTSKNPDELEELACRIGLHLYFDHLIFRRGAKTKLLFS